MLYSDKIKLSFVQFSLYFGCLMAELFECWTSWTHFFRALFLILFLFPCSGLFLIELFLCKNVFNEAEKHSESVMFRKGYLKKWISVAFLLFNTLGRGGNTSRGFFWTSRIPPRWPGCAWRAGRRSAGRRRSPRDRSRWRRGSWPGTRRSGRRRPGRVTGSCSRSRPGRAGTRCHWCTRLIMKIKSNDELTRPARCCSHYGSLWQSLWRDREWFYNHIFPTSAG